MGAESGGGGLIKKMRSWAICICRDGKKSISNKFLFESTPTCIYWPRLELGQEFDKCFFVGNLQGEVRKCKTNSKKTQGDFLVPQKVVPAYQAFVCALAPK